MAKLPDLCYSTLPSTGEKILIKKGERGYIPCHITYTETVEQLNADLGVSKAEQKAMEVGSMFGFHVPGADPDNYNEHGKFIRKGRGYVDE